MKTATAALENNIGTGWWAKRQQQMVAKVLAPLSNAARGVLRLTLPNGNSIEFGDHPCEHFNPVIVLHNWKAVRKAFTGGSVGWSEAYMDGDWDSPDLAMLVEWIVINENGAISAMPIANAAAAAISPTTTTLAMSFTSSG